MIVIPANAGIQLSLVKSIVKPLDPPIREDDKRSQFYILRCDAGIMKVCMRKTAQECLVWGFFSKSKWDVIKGYGTMGILLQEEI